MINFNNFQSKQKYFAAFSFAFFLFLGFQTTASAQVKQDSLMTISVFIKQSIYKEYNRMIITKADETQEVLPLKQLRAWTLEDNTAQIDLLIAQKINEYLRMGWHLFSENNEVDKSETGWSIFYRYILIK
jgi:hypothetical protein